MAFYLIFDFPATAIPAASDMLLMAPHLAAVWLAWKRRRCGAALPWASAFWISPKALFVLRGLLLWDLSGAVWIAAGFRAVLAAARHGCGQRAHGGAYRLRSMGVGARFTRRARFVANPLWNGVLRSANWLGFHAAAVAASAQYSLWNDGTPASSAGRKSATLGLAGAGSLALAGVTAGMRFFPRYYFLLMPPLALMAARGFTLARPARGLGCGAAARRSPLVRFTPDYWQPLTSRNGATSRWIATAAGRRPDARAGPARRHAFCMGLSARALRLHRIAGGHDLSRFAATHRRSGRPASYAIENHRLAFGRRRAA